MIRLRDYQSRCYDAVLRAFQTHDRVLAVLPTGMGKTEVFVSVAQDWEHGRVMVVAPLVQLIGQAAKKIRQRTGVQPGIEQSQLYSNESSWCRSQYIVASKQTLTGKQKRYKRFENIGLLIVDEAHLAVTQPYAELIDYYVGHGAKLLAVTATPKRHDGKAMANICQTCAYEMYINDAIAEGWLVAPHAHCAQLESLDLRCVGTKGANGDFKDGELVKVMEDEKVVFEVAEITAAESVESILGTTRKLKTVVYCAGVNQARQVANRLIDHYGLRADWVCGDINLCSERRRQQVIESFTEDPDGVQIVCNVGVLTTGWDFPGLEHIVMARPTRSLSLFTQIMGRGTRPLEGVVDFEGSTAESRKAAIARSAKPFFKVTDLRDNTLAHKLVTTADVLGGDMGLEVVKRAKKKLAASQGAVDVAEALRESQLELEERERKRMRNVDAKAKYKRTDADVFDTTQRAAVSGSGGRVARMPFGKHKGKPITDVPTGYLKYMLDSGYLKQQWLRDAVEARLGMPSSLKGRSVVAANAAIVPPPSAAVLEFLNAF